MPARTAISPAPLDHETERSAAIAYLDDASRLVEAHRISDQVSRKLRADAAIELSGPFLEAFDELTAASAVSGSPFAHFAATYEHSDPLMALAFNLHITERVVENLCDEEDDPARLTAAVSRSAELGLHCLYDPHCPTARPHRFLGAAKRIGYFFTPPDVAFALARAGLAGRRTVSTLLDPASGAGALLAAAMIEAKTSDIRIDKVRGIELDPFTASISRKLLTRTRELLALDCDIQIATEDAVEFLYEQASAAGGHTYDCILMNPPYGRAKFLRDILTNAETRVDASRADLDALEAEGKAAAKIQAKRFRDMSAFLGVGRGAQDYQRLFMALAIAVLADDGTFALISSDAWLGDASSEALRAKIIGERLLSEVALYPEDSGLFATVNQPTAVAVLDKSPKDDFGVRVMSGSQRHEVDAYRVEYEEVHRLDPKRLRVPRVSADLHDVYAKLAMGPRLRDQPELKNSRGELDLTLGRDLIQEEPSDLRLVRGDHIERFVLREADDSKRPSYVNPERFSDALSSSPKGQAFQQPRIVGRQCSYQKQVRRLIFALAAPGAVAGNSCNYISSVAMDGDDEILQATLVVLNSIVAEFFFRLFNSNNHVANYEIDELPIDLTDVGLVSALAQHGRFLSAVYSQRSGDGNKASHLEDFADALVAFSLGLNEEETYAVVTSIDPERASRVAGMNGFLNREGLPPALATGDGWFQHTAPSLSELDRQIIDHVPQGGNWQDIPESVPSQRLTQIREMTAQRGVVRTTYYGRLRPDQPAYTIATYFNRPGNGTNIHPWENRTLTSREAARLQSFPDWYLFTGSEGAIRKQIGNAVPPLLGFAIGSHLLQLGFDGPWVDLFSGAGGLSLGLEESGCSVAAAVDNDSAATRTYRLNRPCELDPSSDMNRTLVLESDLSIANEVDKVVSAIREKLAGKPPMAVVGGPPCQGFSHAGWRHPQDERNHLASAFMRVVADLQPELVVLENVEGLLSYDKGRTLAGLVATLRELGYSVENNPWLLRAESFGVPQMRRRVFLVANKSGPCIPPPEPTHQVCKGRREDAAQVSLPGSLPYPVTVAEALSGPAPLNDVAHPSLGDRPVRSNYLRWLRDEVAVHEIFK